MGHIQNTAFTISLASLETRAQGPLLVRKPNFPSPSTVCRAHVWESYSSPCLMFSVLWDYDALQDYCKDLNEMNHVKCLACYLEHSKDLTNVTIVLAFGSKCLSLSIGLETTIFPGDPSISPTHIPFCWSAFSRDKAELRFFCLSDIILKPFLPPVSKGANSSKEEGSP